MKPADDRPLPQKPAGFVLLWAGGAWRQEGYGDAVLTGIAGSTL